MCFRSLTSFLALFARATRAHEERSSVFRSSLADHSHLPSHVCSGAGKPLPRIVTSNRSGLRSARANMNSSASALRSARPATLPLPRSSGRTTSGAIASSTRGRKRRRSPRALRYISCRSPIGMRKCFRLRSGFPRLSLPGARSSLICVPRRERQAPPSA